MFAKIFKAIPAFLLCVACGCTGNFTPETPSEITAEAPPRKESADPILLAESISDSDFAGFDNTLRGWGFKKTKGKEPDIPEKDRELLKKHNACYMDESRGKTLYLTFDEGYENGYTGQILDVLKRCEIPAAFFVTGHYLENEPELIRRMLDEGHIVGNHTVRHPNLPKLVSAREMTAELCSLNEKFASVYGGTMLYMRPPEGEYSERALAVAAALGYKTVFWSFAYKDWDPSVVKGSAYAFDQITPYLHDGAILLLHAVSKDNADALESVIAYAENEGYRFESLDKLP